MKPPPPLLPLSHQMHHSGLHSQMVTTCFSVVICDSKMKKHDSVALSFVLLFRFTLQILSIKSFLFVETLPREWNGPLTRLAQSFCWWQRLNNELLIIKPDAGAMMIYNLMPYFEQLQANLCSRRDTTKDRLLLLKRWKGESEGGGNNR